MAKQDKKSARTPQLPEPDALTEFAEESAVLPSNVTPAQVGLAQRTFGGFLWILSTSAAVKVVTVGGQLLLARILFPSDFGLVALAYSVTTFTSVLQRNGLRDILVQKAEKFDHYRNAAFWMSLSTGLLVAVLTVAAAPLAARIYDQPGLIKLLWILALTGPLQALQTVPGACLQNQLRFKSLSVVSMFEGVGTILLTLAFAWRGFGAMSLVLPFPIVQTISLGLLWGIARLHPSGSLDLHLWPELLASSGLLLGAGALYAFNVQGANIVLGLVRDLATVGIFFFGYNLSNQLCGFLTNNLWSVLLPSLSQLKSEPKRQMQAFLRVSHAVNLVGMFVCFLLAIIADPALRLLYGERWVAAIPVLQVVSLGMAFNISFSLSINLMMAQGRYRTLLMFNVWRALGFILLVAVGGSLGGAVAVSIGVSVFFVLYGPIATHLAISAAGGGWAEVWGVHWRPLSVSALSCALAYLLVVILLQIPSPLIALLLLIAVSTVLFCFLTLWLLPQAWSEIVDRIRANFSLLHTRKPTATQ